MTATSHPVFTPGCTATAQIGRGGDPYSPLSDMGC